MKFLWPELLWLLLALPVLVAVYVWLLRRRKRSAVRYASLNMVKEALGAGPRFRRHIPPLLFLCALALMIAAIARPTAIVMLPSQQETLILAMDVSGSMRAKDVEPNRLAAAQAAAKTFVAELPRTVRVGVVSFAGTAAVVQAPTHNREDVAAAIDRFQLQRGTAIGSGIIVALATLLPDAGIIVSDLIYGRNEPRPIPLDRGRKAEDKAAKKEFKPVPPGSYASGAIILLTDGQRTAGPDSIEAAKMAADHGVRVFTVGFGTPNGEVLGFEGWSFRARLDEDTLKGIANITRGEYFYAGSATDLKKAYEALSARIVFEKKEMEITAFFAAGAAALALLAAFLSLLWFNRIL
ncbi:MAG TPA: VWA domain-containing protein [Burkholderiales bacterium]|nr:VWA domain-containing protein [Burkholderiales bacterium]